MRFRSVHQRCCPVLFAGLIAGRCLHERGILLRAEGKKDGFNYQERNDYELRAIGDCRPVIADGYIAIEGNRMHSMGPMDDWAMNLPGRRQRNQWTPRVRLSCRVIITHTHMPYVLGHNMPVDFSQLHDFWDMLQKMGWEWLEDLMTQEGVYAATRYAATKMLKNGVTTVCELVEGPNALPGILDASARAIDEAGIQAKVGFEVTERIPGEHILIKTSVKREIGLRREHPVFWKSIRPNGGKSRGVWCHTALQFQGNPDQGPGVARSLWLRMRSHR